MHSTSKSIGRHTYTLYGVNADILHWVRGSDLARAALEPAGVGEDDLFIALGATDYNERVEKAKRVIHKLWFHEQALGPYPFLETLAEFQFGSFYSGYRDHVCHQLDVYLLGLMAYDSCPALRDGLDETFAVPAENARAELLVRWLVTAVYHDIGYVLEAEGAADSESEEWQRTAQAFNECLSAPLSTLPAFKELLPRSTEKAVIRNQRIFTHPELEHPTQLDAYQAVDVLNALGEEAERAGLGSRSAHITPLRAYYDYARSTKPADRSPFRDHGVASALLLLQTWRSFQDYVGQLAVCRNEPLLERSLSEIDALAKKLPGRHASVRAAAAAMALHNISPKSWKHGDALEKGLRFGEFKICLSNPTRRTPLAFLLGLVDSLQDWDRPRFRPIREGDKKPMLTGQDLSITGRDGKLHIYVQVAAERFKHPATDPDSPFVKLASAMKEYLEAEAVDATIAWGDAPPHAEPPARSANAEPPKPAALTAFDIAALDPLVGARQSTGALGLFLAGTELLRKARKRVAISAFTPILVVGPRPYDNSQAPPFYEKEQFDEYLLMFSRAAVGMGAEVVCVGCTSAIREAVESVAPEQRPAFAARVRENVEKLHHLSGVRGARCSLRLSADPPMTFLVADDRFMIWVKTQNPATGATEKTWMVAESTLVADALFRKAVSTGADLPRERLFAEIGVEPG